MSVEVNWLAVALATVSTMAVGSIWYTPKVFGNTWIRLAYHRIRVGSCGFFKQSILQKQFFAR